MNIQFEGFKNIQSTIMPSIGSEVHKIVHERTGLKILYMKNTDKNKVFCATFRTPPLDNSGAPHILEHSVLCGSEKYMARDLFNELMKGSVNTYLNAMTFSDKTMYPVASVNDKDFFNLAKVYLDSVFNPLIHEKPEFFAQEGWSYSLIKKNAPLEIKGIVYNEMKGAYAQPERILIKKIDETLFSGTPYEYDSGGVPGAIPQLSFESLLDYYNDYYCPSNCLIYFYGDLDINHALSLVSEALSTRAAKPAPEINLKPSATQTRQELSTVYYSVSEEKKDGCYFAASLPCCDYTDYYTVTALEMLNFILAGNDAAPLRSAFRDSGLCGDFVSYYRTSSEKTLFSFLGKNCEESAFTDFTELLHETLCKIAENGIDSELIDAAFNKWEFFINEEDFGERPTGLHYGILAASAWVYGGDILNALDIKSIFSRIRDEAHNGLFERLLKDYLIENNQSVYTVLKPRLNLNEETENALKQKLIEYKKSLSDNDIEELLARTRLLNKFRKKPDLKRNLRKIPALAPRDISRETVDYGCKHDENGVFHKHDKDGIAYVNLHFDLERVPEELVPYCGLLKELLGKTNTASFSSSALINALNVAAGGVRYTCDALQLRNGYLPRLNIKIKALEKNMEAVLGLISEAIAPRLDVSAVKKFREETLLKTENHFRSNGHSVAINRSLSYIFPAANFVDLISGIGFYNEISSKTPEEITQSLNRLMGFIFSADNLFYGIASSGSPALKSEVSSFSNGLCPAAPPQKTQIAQSCSRDEAFILDSGVSFNAKAYNLFDTCDRYSGKLQAAKSLLSLNYLWPEIRNSGGAYGCGAGFSRNGSAYFYSYRDPEIIKTYDTFDNSFDFLKKFTSSKEEFGKYVINAIKPFEKPLKPYEKLEAAVSDRLLGITDDMRRTEREEILSASPSDMNAIGETLTGLAGKGYVCSLGSKGKIEEANIFTDIKNLLTRRIN